MCLIRSALTITTYLSDNSTTVSGAIA